MEPLPKKPRKNNIQIRPGVSLSDDTQSHQSYEEVKDSSTAEMFQTLQDVEIVRILNNSDEKCCIAVEGKFNGEKAVIVLQKSPFNKEKLPDIFSGQTTLKTLFKNDIYYNQVASIPVHLNEVRANIIYPANEKHLNKYERQTSSCIVETPELYKNVTFPYIQSSSHSMQWIYNILEHKKEVDRIVCEDLDPQVGFVLVPDMKWTGGQVEDLYLQAIVMRRDVTSIRDLRSEHLPLLRNVFDKCTKAISAKYSLPSSKLRVYFHYQPSYYHLHIHFSALNFDAPGTWAGKAHLLQDVISNLEVNSEHYEKASVSYTLKDNHPLMLKLKKYGYFDTRNSLIEAPI